MIPKEFIELSCLTANSVVPLTPRFSMESCFNEDDGVALALPVTVRVVAAVTLPSYQQRMKELVNMGLRLRFLDLVH